MDFIFYKANISRIIYEDKNIKNEILNQKIKMIQKIINLMDIN
jgi:hypothetical protein